MFEHLERALKSAGPVIKGRFEGNVFVVRIENKKGLLKALGEAATLQRALTVAASELSGSPTEAADVAVNLKVAEQQLKSGDDFAATFHNFHNEVLLSTNRLSGPTLSGSSLVAALQSW